MPSISSEVTQVSPNERTQGLRGHFTYQQEDN